MSNPPGTVNFRQLLEQQYVKTEQLRVKLERLEQSRSEPIAIIGLGCRFPGGANDPESFWQLLERGGDAVTEVPAERFPAPKEDEDLPWRRGARWGAFLTSVDGFDPQFFAISPREAVELDPQQRLILEVAWESLEHAGLDPEQLAGSRTGVFLGVSTNDYQQLSSDIPKEQLGIHTTTGGGQCFPPGRLSYVLGLQGPSMTIDTACSSSLVAVHQACQSLRSKECSLALAGGVSLMLTPLTTDLIAATHALSPEGRCKVFDAGANGFVRGEGCGIIVLKRLSDALAQQDRILAVILGSAVNHDGRSTGLTAPNGHSQQALIKQALASAHISGAQVSYVEAHGTGTPLGDPIEVEALTAALGDRGPNDSSCVLGSVKANIGHLEAAAGIASLIKVVLSMQHERIPPQLHFRRLNPRIRLAGTPFVVPTEVQPWRAGGARRMAGVSSFGMSGTNAHVILAEAASASVKEAPDAAGERPAHLLVLSARSAKALQDQARRYADLLERGFNLPDVCFSAATGRSQLPHRLAVSGTDGAKAASRLRAWAAGASDPGIISGTLQPDAQIPKIAFLFTGQGAQYAGMGRILFETQPVFRAALLRCQELLKPLLDRNLLELLFAESSSSLDETSYTQPALFAIEYALAELWRSFGIEPDAVIGHSVGEYAAACVAGVCSLEAGLQLVAERGRLMQTLPRGGAMASIDAEAARVTAAIAPYAEAVSISAFNGAEQVVIAGSEGPVAAVCRALEMEGVRTKRLRVSHAFHSPLMDPILKELECAAAKIPMQPPRLPLVSNVSARIIGDQVTHPSYWRYHARAPVRFTEGMSALYQLGCTIFIEIGPHPTLIGLARDGGSGAGTVWLPSLRRDRDDWATLLNSLGMLFVAGKAIDWRGFDAPYRRKRVDLPTYPFQRQRYWLAQLPGRRAFSLKPAASDMSAKRHPLLGHTLCSSLLPGQRFWEVTLDAGRPSYLADHRVLGKTTLPGSAALEMALAAGMESLGQSVQLEDVMLPEALILTDEHPHVLQLAFTSTFPLPGNAEFQVASQPVAGTDRWHVHAKGRLCTMSAEDAGAESAAFVSASEGWSAPFQGEALYKALSACELDYGKSFQCVQTWRIRSGESLGLLALPESLRGDSPSYQIHPALLDGCLQLLMAPLLTGSEQSLRPIVPVSFRCVRLHRRPGQKVQVHARLQLDDGQTVEGDVHAFDEEGKLVLALLGVTGRRIARLPANIRNSLLVNRWQPAPIPAPRQPPLPSHWLLLSNESTAASALQAELERLGGTVVHATAQAGHEKDVEALVAACPKDVSPAGIVYLCDPDPSLFNVAPSEVLSRKLRTACGQGLLLIKALAQGRWHRQPRLWVVTRGTQPAEAEGADVSAPLFASLWGLCRTLAHEHPDMRPTCIDLGPNAADDEARLLAAEILADHAETEVALRSGTRYVARLSPLHWEELLQSAAASSTLIQGDRTYLLTGGLGGLGLALASWLADQGARHLVLIGRGGVRTSEEQAAVARLQAAGVQVRVAMCDVADGEALASLLLDISASMPPLRGVVHAAGRSHDAPLVEQDEESFMAILSAKVAGAWNLHMQTRAVPLDFFVLYSSAASLLGSGGQGAYAAANAVLDALAHGRQAARLPALSINWGAFRDTGMAAYSGRLAQLAQRGMDSLSPEEGTAVLGHLLGKHEHPQVGVVPLSLPRWFTRHTSMRTCPKLELLLAKSGLEQTAAEAPAFQEQLRVAPVLDRLPLIRTHLAAQVAQVVWTEPDKLKGSESFASLGFDSLMGIELRNRLQESMGLRLSAALTWEYPTIDQLAQYLCNAWNAVQLVQEREEDQVDLSNETTDMIEIKI